MEFETIELTVEDILRMHRHWITKLFVDDNKTDTEIINLLYRRGFSVTSSQLRRCISEWGLARQNLSNVPALLPELAVDWEWVPSRNSPTPSQHSFTPSDPGMVDHYTKKKLPSIPAQKGASSKDRLKVTCHHGPSESEAHEVETTLSNVPNGPTPLEAYAEDEQRHEILALGLNTQQPSLPRFRRASQAVGDRPRQRQHPRLRKRSEIVLRKKKE